MMMSDITTQNEGKAVERLLRSWHKVDIEARSFTNINAELARARLVLKRNKHWSKLSSIIMDISLALKHL